eukprot:GHVH01002331.1.p1 GENE.GHVH01002331.1~~GHVH01002331.1.p1  ORF type:complete len:790 (+),score=117.70 GHVH01002331.1:586-2955(+)
MSHCRFRFRESINAILSGCDVFCMMPTGGGKSLCFQLPALLDGTKVSVVVMPLISLMQDQFEQMNELGLPCAYLAGATTLGEVRQIQDECESGDIRLLFVTPEKIQASESFNSFLMRLYQNNKLARFVIDEAHCVSQWGNDFRKDYLQLSSLRSKYPAVPIAAFTATATRQVIKDVTNQLKMRDTQLFQRSFDRPNLLFEVRMKKKSSLMTDIVKLLKDPTTVKYSAIVYCFSQKECTENAKELRDRGIKALPYHAGLSSSERQENQLSWMNDRARVICATIAFGMGINKKDVRLVIHTSMPKTLENYYQEAGRAGRDGNNASCILFYDYMDKSRQQSLMMRDAAYIDDAKMKGLSSMTHYCESLIDCRRSLILSHFGEIPNSDHPVCQPPNLLCDNCSRTATYSINHRSISNETREIIKSIRSMGNRSNGRAIPHCGETMKSLTEFLMGSTSKKIKDKGLQQKHGYGLLKKLSWKSEDASRLVKMLINQNILSEVMVKMKTFNSSYQNVTPYLCEARKTQSMPVDQIPMPTTLAFLTRTKPLVSTPSGVNAVETMLSADQWIEKDTKEKIYPGVCETLSKSERVLLEQRLKDCRERHAQIKGIKNHSSVLSQRGLKWLCENLPITIYDLRKCTDFGVNKIAKYGQGFIDVVGDFLREVGKTNLAMASLVNLDDSDDSNELVVINPAEPVRSNSNRQTSYLDLRSRDGSHSDRENVEPTKKRTQQSYIVNPIDEIPNMKRMKYSNSPIQTRLKFGKDSLSGNPPPNPTTYMPSLDEFNNDDNFDWDDLI